MPLENLLDILYVGTLPPHQGGSAFSSSQILAGLVRLGHSVRAISPIRESELEAGDSFAADHPEFSIRRFAEPFDYNAPGVPAPEDFLALERREIARLLPERIAERRPDLVFIGRESFAAHVVPVIERFGLPSILRITGTQIAAIAEGAYPAPAAREVMQPLKSVGMVCPQAGHMAAILRGLGVAEVRTIPNAVDLERFAPGPRDEGLLRRLSIGPDLTVVMHLSNMKPLKRICDIVRSARIVLTRAPRVVYVMVGDGTARKEAQDLCEREGLTNHFRFTGWVDYGLVPGYLNSADIVVMPSGLEHQARVYLEAMACGRLLLASNVAGAREVLEDGESGLLFRTGDVDDLAEKTLRAASDPALRAAIGIQARERVSRHDVRAVSAAYAAAMAEVMSQSQARVSRGRESRT
jgi:glycosyltransferase involved in cell wall biosynthesis